MDQSAYQYYTIEDAELRWRDSLEALKSFISKDLELTGKWTSPVRDLKVFTNVNESSSGNETLKIKWYQGKKVFLVQGDRADDIETKIDEKIQSNLAIDEGETTVNNNMNMNINLLHTNDSEITEAVKEIKVQIQQLISDLKNNRTSIVYLESSYQNLKNTESHELWKIKHELKVIRSEHEIVKKENAQYLERISNLAFIVSDLNTKIKLLEEEKLSLITSVRILNEEYRHIIQGNSNLDECNKNSSPPSPKKTNITDPSGEILLASVAIPDEPVITKIVNCDKTTYATQASSENLQKVANCEAMAKQQNETGKVLVEPARSPEKTEDSICSGKNQGGPTAN